MYPNFVINFSNITVTVHSQMHQIYFIVCIGIFGGEQIYF